MALFPEKITITSEGVFIDQLKLPGVTVAEVKNINLGHNGMMEVALQFQVREVDIQYRQRIGFRDELSEEG